jgi:hypothetical protein
MVLRSFFFILSVFVFISAVPHSASANENDFIVFDVRKTLPLNDTDPVYRDYYVNIGTETGVHAGSILAVYRRLPVIDVYRNKAQGDLVIPVGHLKVIHSQKTMSVCRIASIASEKQIPVVSYETVMMGDRVEIAGADDAKKEASENPTETSKTAASEATTKNDGDSVTGESPRDPAAAAAQTESNPPAPAKQLPQKLKPKQAKPSVKAIPLPTQATL